MSKGARAARAAGTVSFAVLLSRILGLVREQVFAGLFGAGLFMDAWLVAFRIPNLLRDLFAEGALSSAFVPTFTESLEKEGKSHSWELANLVLSALMILLGLTTLLLFYFSDYFVLLLAAGYEDVPGKVEVTSVLIKILSPFLALVAFASVTMGILNTLNHYFLPALAPALFNLTLILSGLLLAPRFEESGLLPIYAMGVGAIIGGVLQWAVQIPLLRRHGFRFRFRINFQHPGIRRMARLIGPAIVGVSAVQINVLVNTQLASFLQDNGPVSWLSYSFRIIYLPIGLFGVAVGVVNLKEVSSYAARRQWEELKETVANSIRLIGFLSIPSAIGLFLLAGPVVRVLFERGDFDPSDTRFTAYAVMAYSIGLFAYSAIKVYVPTFYALNDTRTPVRISIIAVVTNIIVNVTLILILPDDYRYIGLALGTSASVILNSNLLAYYFRRRLGDLRVHGVLPMMAKTLLAGAVMGLAVAWMNSRWMITSDQTTISQVSSLFFIIVVAVFIFVAICRGLNVEELNYFLPRRLRK